MSIALAFFLRDGHPEIAATHQGIPISGSNRGAEADADGIAPLPRFRPEVLNTTGDDGRMAQCLLSFTRKETNHPESQSSCGQCTEDGDQSWGFVNHPGEATTRAAGKALDGAQHSVLMEREQQYCNIIFTGTTSKNIYMVKTKSCWLTVT